MSTLASLRAEALAARQANDPNRAAEAWRALLDASPDDWALALELKRDLKAGWHYPDSDPRFRRAARYLPDAEWLAHYAALYAFHGSDLEAIDARARALLRQHPHEPRLHAIRGDVARQRRDWPGALASLTEATRLDPANPDYAEKLAAAARYDHLARCPWSAGGPPYAAYVVNLDRNAERMAELARQFAGCPVPLRRQPAVEGSRLPAAAVARLTGSATSPRGTLGCFLSHAAAWEALVASGDSHALILEDDVIPLLELPASLDALALPADAGLCFANDRLQPRPDPARPPDPASPLAWQPLATTVAAFHPDDNAPGGDGYILSRPAAQSLLAWLAADGMADDVDWRLLAYALTPAEVAAIPAHTVARRELDRLTARIGRPDRLRAYTLDPALIRTVGVSSDREDQNRLHPC